MRRPSEVYAEGYAKGQGSGVADATWGRDIRDVSEMIQVAISAPVTAMALAGAEFNPPSDADQKPRPQQSSGSSASAVGEIMVQIVRCQ